MVSPTVVSAGIGAGSSLANTAFNYFAGKSASRDQYWHQVALMNKQYKLQQRNYKEAPSAQRIGLENAGYNPILAVNNGVSYSNPGLGSATQGDYGTSDLGNSINSAYQTFKLNNDQTKSVVALNNATKDNQTAQAVKAQQETISEGIKQDGYVLDNVYKQLQNIYQNKDNSWKDRREAQALAESVSRTKLNYNQAVVNNINANANSLSAQASMTNARGSYYFNTHRALGFSSSITNSSSDNKNFNIKFTGLGSGSGWSNSTSTSRTW